MNIKLRSIFRLSQALLISSIVLAGCGLQNITPTIEAGELTAAKLIANASPKPVLSQTATPVATNVETPTLEPTPTAPVLPPMPEGGVNTIIDGDRTYALNEAGDKIGRYDSENKIWQARHDLTIEEVTYEGWTIEKGEMDITDGVPIHIRVIGNEKTNSDYSYSKLTLDYGTISKLEVVEINNGEESVERKIFDVRYFFKDGGYATVTYSANNYYISGRGGGLIELGNRVGLGLRAPIGDKYSQSLKNMAKKNLPSAGFNLTDFQFELLFESGNLSSAEVISFLNSLNAGDILDLSPVFVDQLHG